MPNQQTSKNSSKTSGSRTMAELLASYKSPLVSFKKGDMIKGTITKLTGAEILVNVEAKTEAVVLEKDRRILKNILSTLKEGDQVQVQILDPESDKGHPVVSLRRFMDNISWKGMEDLKSKKQEMEVTVLESTKGGFLVQTPQGLSGFLPNSYITGSNQNLVGSKIKAYVLELDRPERKIIFSQKPILGTEDFEKLIKGLRTEQKIDTIISNVIPFGLFVTLQSPQGDTLDGLIHISEISWDKVENIAGLFAIGQKVEAVIISFDKDAKRVDLSIKRLTADPFSKITKNLTVDQKVKGTVLKIIPQGLSVELDMNGEKLEGFIRKEKIPPTVSFNIGDKITATISEIDTKRHRIILIPVLLEKPIGYR